MGRWWLIFLVVCTVARADLQASLDQQQIHADAQVVLTLQAKNPSAEAVLDLSPLEVDFRLLSQVDSHYLRIEKGSLVTIKQWVLHLQPRRDGQLQVPPLQLGEHRSAALDLTVLHSSIPPTPTPRAFMELEITPNTPYVLSEFNLTVRLYHNARLLQGALEDPQLEGVQMQRLRNNLSREVVRDGQAYQVLESHYAVFPETSGVLPIPPVRFRGRAAYAADEVPTTQLYRQTQQLQVQSAPQELRILPPVAGFSGEHWLAARTLELSTHWPEVQEPIPVGEPLTITLVIEAQGLHAYQLPELPLPKLPHVRLYRELSNTGEQDDDTWITARREERLTLIPTQAGELRFPALQLPWWDTAQHRERIATLAAKTLQVGTLPAQQPTTSGHHSPIIALGIGLLLLAGVSHYRLRASPRQQLRQSCRRNHPSDTMQALRHWGAWLWPTDPPRSCGEIAQRLHLEAVLVELDRALYQAPGGSQRWQGMPLWRAVARLRPGRLDTKTPPPLACLYPQRQMPPRTPPW